MNFALVAGLPTRWFKLAETMRISFKIASEI
jgi:hypothetical protein